MSYASITCGHCGRTHTSVTAVAVCAGIVAPAGTQVTPAPVSPRSVAYSASTGPSVPAWHNRPPTQRQLEYIQALADEKGVTVTVWPTTGGAASRTIKQLKERPAVARDETPLVPIHLLKMIRTGRYAVPNHDATETIFVRIAERKVGTLRGAIIVQTKHSDGWVQRLAMSPEGRVLAQRRDTIKGTPLADVIIEVMSDQAKAAIEYAERCNECSRCGKGLTDDRSRWLGIGPDCEKIWPWYESAVIERKGEYAPGAAS